MIKKGIVVSLVLVSGLFGCKNVAESQTSIHNILSEAEAAKGWTLLFDGETSTGWRSATSDAFPESGWQIAQGELRSKPSVEGENNGGDIVTIEKFGYFDLQLEWKMDTEGGNSGVKYAVAEAGPDVSVVGLEYQLLDDENFEWMNDGRMTTNDYRTLGALYELYEPNAKKRPMVVGEWQRSRIILRDNHIEHWLNDRKILDVVRGTEDWHRRVAESKFHDVPNFGEAALGHILLQDHGSAMAFRNIKIRELD